MARIRRLQKKLQVMATAGVVGALGILPYPVWQNDTMRRIFLHH